MEKPSTDQSDYDDEGFEPNTDFVKRLLAVRKQAVLDGDIRLLTTDEILKQKEEGRR